MTGTAAGFGFPIYSNVIGVTVQGITGSSVLVTGTTFADGVRPIHRLEVYDSESLANTRTIALANTPNSLVVAPNGTTAYVGDACPTPNNCAGLVVVNLTTFQPSLQTYPIVGGLSTDVITGKVLGSFAGQPLRRALRHVSAAQRYVFLIDTTGTKSPRVIRLPAINAVTFAADGSNMWIGGTGGVYVFNADTFVPISSHTLTDAGLSTDVKALAWMPDGQSYFASGDQLVNYSTCNEQKPKQLSLDSSHDGAHQSRSHRDRRRARGGGSVTATQWLDYSVTTSAQIRSIASNAVNAGQRICGSTVTVNAPVATTVSLPCTATQVTFSPRLEAEFVTGVDPLLHGYGFRHSRLQPGYARGNTVHHLRRLELRSSRLAAAYSAMAASCSSEPMTARQAQQRCIASTYQQVRPQPARCWMACSRKTCQSPSNWSPASSRLSLSKRRDF